MKKFKFKLERVFQYREIVKQEKKRELTIAQNKLNTEKEILSELEKQALINHIEQDKPMLAAQVYLIGAYARRLKEEILKQGIKIVEAELEVEKALKNYIEAAKDHKALEVLKQKRLQDYREYIDKEEGKFLDELSVQRIGLLKRLFE